MQQVGSVRVSGALRGAPAHRGTFARAPRAPRTTTLSRVPARAFLTDVSKYLAEAAAQIFHPTETDVPWERSAEPFTGGIAHHGELDKLRQLQEAVRTARKQLEGCTDPNATNFDPAATADDGSCVYSFGDSGELVNVSGTTQAWVTEAIDRVFGHNFKGDDTEPGAYFSTGYAARGRSQRELRREVDRLRRFEQVVQTAIDSAEGGKQE